MQHVIKCALPQYFPGPIGVAGSLTLACCTVAAPPKQAVYGLAQTDK